MIEVTVQEDLAGLDRVVKAKAPDEKVADENPSTENLSAENPSEENTPVENPSTENPSAESTLSPSSPERISYYEALFDKLSEADPDTPLTADAREALRILEDYYSSGQWLADYEADEAGAYPTELKRGVLSQDGLYDILSLFK